MELLAIFIGALLLKGLIELIKWFFSSKDVDIPNVVNISNVNDLPNVDNLTCAEIFKLADKYCYGEGVKRNSKVARYLINHVIENGTKSEIKKALDYKKDYC